MSTSQQQGQQLARDYERRVLQGWAGTTRPDLIRGEFDLLAAGFRPFHVRGQTRPTAGRKTMLYQVCRKVLGKDTDNYAQEIGDCVSFGYKNGTEYLQCCEKLLSGKQEKWRPVFPPYYYGTGRTYIGGGQMGNEDGSSGSWMAEAIQKYGTLFADEPNVPKYSGRIAKAWGDPNPRQDLDQWQDVAKHFLIHSAALIKTWDDLCAALVNGYPVTTASDVGYSMEASRDGFHAQTTSWSHEMCCPKGTIILGPKVRLAEDVQVGDLVYGHDGKEHLVTKTYRRRHVGPVVRLGVVGKQPLTLTPNHPVLVYRRSLVRKKVPAHATVGVVSRADLPSYQDPADRHFDSVWVTAGDVRPGDYVMTPCLEQAAKPTLPIWQRPERAVKDLPDIQAPDDELAWLFGFYVGDGNLRKGHGINLTLGLHKPLDRVLAALRKLGVEPKVDCYDTYVRVRVDSVILEASFAAWFGAYSAEKHFPEWLFRGWNLQAALEGLMDADGCRYKGRYVYTTVSKVLAEQVRFILAALGQFCAVYAKDNTGSSYANTAPMVELTWRPASADQRFRVRHGFVLHKVKSALLMPYDDDVFNYEVADVRSYLADGFVVHNCFVGIDETYTESYALLLNSWGDAHGRLKDFQTNEDLPIGVLRVRRKDAEKHLRAGETFAVSQFDGFPEQDLDKALFLLI